MPRKLSHDFVFKEFKKRDYTLISKYKNSKTKVEYICPKGHKGCIKYNNFKNGNGCAKCVGKKIYTFKEVYETFRKEGFKLLSTKYKNNTTKLDYICSNGHYGKIQFKTFLTGTGCSYCAALKKMTPFKTIEKEFIKRNYTLLSTKEDRTSTKTKLKYECPNGHIGYTTWSCFQQSKGCKLCFTNSLLMDYNIIENEFNKRGYILLTTNEERKGKHDLLEYICPKGHCHRIKWGPFRLGQGCPYCMYKNEQKCRKILETYFNKSFPKCKPTWLNGLELDCYNEELQLALEYNGQQHYTLNNWNKTEQDLLDQQWRDWTKARVCEAVGVRLVVVPYWVDDLEGFILEQITYK